MNRGTRALVSVVFIAASVGGLGCDRDESGDAPRAAEPRGVVSADDLPDVEVESEAPPDPPQTPIQAVKHHDAGSVAAPERPRKKGKPEPPAKCELPPSAYVSGLGIWRGGARRVIQRRIGQIRNCYERSLRYEPELTGRVTVEFTVSGSGKVTKAKVASTTLDHKTTEDCVVKVIERTTFPQTPCGSETKYSYPFQFVPPDP
jgi:TonB family protein